MKITREICEEAIDKFINERSENRRTPNDEKKDFARGYYDYKTGDSIAKGDFKRNYGGERGYKRGTLLNGPQHRAFRDAHPRSDIDPNAQVDPVEIANKVKQDRAMPRAEDFLSYISKK